MTDVPERIWAASVNENYGEWQTATDGLPRPTEYTRSDLVAELAAENERLKQRLANHQRDTSPVDAQETANVSDKPEGQQPVTWRWKPKDWAEWIYDPKHEWLEAQSRDEIDAEPLFTRPSEQAVTEAGKGLLRIVEEIYGAMKHGTWRDEKGMRLKDTAEWVVFYVALNAAMDAGE